MNNMDTSNVTNMSNMFYGCSNLINLDISNFVINDNCRTKNMFFNCSDDLKNKIKQKLKTINEIIFEDNEIDDKSVFEEDDWTNE